MVTAWTGNSPPPLYDLTEAHYHPSLTLESTIYDLTVDWTQIWPLERAPIYIKNATRVSVYNGSIRDAFPLPPRHLSWTPYKITGTVVDSNEDIVAGAEVYLIRGDFQAVTLIQKTTSAADGCYLFYVDDLDDSYTVLSWKWDAGLGEYVRGVTDRDLKAVAS